MTRQQRFLAIGACAVLAAGTAAGARADAIADFYAGKDITILVGYGAGGGNDSGLAGAGAGLALRRGAIRNCLIANNRSTHPTGGQGGGIYQRLHELQFVEAGTVIDT